MRKILITMILLLCCISPLFAADNAIDTPDLLMEYDWIRYDYSTNTYYETYDLALRQNLTFGFPLFTTANEKRMSIYYAGLQIHTAVYDESTYYYDGTDIYLDLQGSIGNYTVTVDGYRDEGFYTGMITGWEIPLFEVSAQIDSRSYEPEFSVETIEDSQSATLSLGRYFNFKTVNLFGKEVESSFFVLTKNTAYFDDDEKAFSTRMTVGTGLYF